MKNLIIIIFLVVLFSSEVLIFKKKNWNKLVEKTGKQYEEIMEKF
jgi:hypothetical protein|tara:strand:- start:584 stop:718 length:135 start_codon:yes stop_codon:yes gene_type:complete